MQNGMNEERIAKAAGWGRTVGCIISTISVNCYEPGHISRYQQPGSGKHAVFRVGEVHGRVTARATELADILDRVDTARVTENLWGERWTKLIANTITQGLLGATGLDNRLVYVERGKAHRLGIRLAGEAIRVGWAQGYEIGTVLGLQPQLWVDAADDKPEAIKAVQLGMEAWMATLLEPSQSSVGRDVARGRRSEIQFTNGLVAEKGEEVGVPAPTHAALTSIVLRIDRGEMKPRLQNLDSLPE
jgi:2-dehydropantoate 2-reductase